MAKILGKTTDNSVLVEMSKDELAKLMGYESMWSIGYQREKAGQGNSTKDLFEPGTEIPFGEVWSRVDKICNSERTFFGIAAEMRKAAEWLDTIPAIINPPDPKKSSKKDETNA